MKKKYKRRLQVLNTITVSTFVLAVLVTYFNVKIAYVLLAMSFSVAVFSVLLKHFWSQVKQLKQKQNGRQA